MKKRNKKYKISLIFKDKISLIIAILLILIAIRSIICSSFLGFTGNDRLTIFVTFMTFAGVIILYEGISLQSKNLKEYQKEKAEHQLHKFIERMDFIKNDTNQVSNYNFNILYGNYELGLGLGYDLEEKLRKWIDKMRSINLTLFDKYIFCLDLAINTINDKLEGDLSYQQYLYTFLTKKDQIFLLLYSKFILGEVYYNFYQGNSIFRDLLEEDFANIFGVSSNTIGFEQMIKKFKY